MLKLSSTKSKVQHVKMLCYGDSGTGKTYLCRTAPRPVIISAEQGLLSLADVDIPVLEVRTLADVEEAYKHVAASKEYDTICIDSLSDLAESLLLELKEDPKFRDPRQAYGQMADEMSRLTRMFRDIPNKHVYVIAKQIRVSDEATGAQTYEPMIPGKSFAANVSYFFDLVVALRIGKREKETYRYLQTQPSIQYRAKDRSGKLAAQEEPNLAALFKKIVS